MDEEPEPNSLETFESTSVTFTILRALDWQKQIRKPEWNPLHALLALWSMLWKDWNDAFQRWRWTFGKSGLQQTEIHAVRQTWFCQNEKLPWVMHFLRHWKTPLQGLQTQTFRMPNLSSDLQRKRRDNSGWAVPNEKHHLKNRTQNKRQESDEALADNRQWSSFPKSHVRTMPNDEVFLCAGRIIDCWSEPCEEVIRCQNVDFAVLRLRSSRKSLLRVNAQFAEQNWPR